MCTLYAHATGLVTLRPGLDCSIRENLYRIEFTMPNFHIGVDTLFYGTNFEEDVFFSTMVPDEIDEFDYLETSGRPSLPFYSVDLILPNNVSQFEISNITILDSIVIDLPLKYMPAQQQTYLDTLISYDYQYYNTYHSNWNETLCRIDTSNYRQYKGLNFSLYPCHYEPLSNQLVVITRATYEISFNGMELPYYIDHYLDEHDRLAYNFYDNFEVYPELLIPPISGDEYLIISTDDWIEETALLEFVGHKEELGYHVTLVSTLDIGRNPLQIRTFIQNHYNEYKTKYVLLVGDVPDLPFFEGNQEDMSNPPSDLYYSCLSRSNASSQWTDFNPTIFIGRWPIQNTYQLRLIVDKTINSDLYLERFHPQKVGLFSGSGSNANYFYKDCKYIYENVIQPYYTGYIVDGEECNNNNNNNNNNNCFTNLQHHLEENTPPIWLFIYTGHGNSQMIGDPYYISCLNIGNIDTYSLDFQSFGFGFACLLGNIYDSYNFSRAWIADKKGGVTYMGATTITTKSSDRYFSRKLFNQLKKKPIMTIGEFIGNGKAKYYNPDKVVWRRREAKKYILYGDPSLYLFGLDHHSIPAARIKSRPHNYQTEEEHDKYDILIKNDILFLNTATFGNIKTIEIHSMTGQLLLTVHSQNQIHIQGLPAGIYAATITNKENKQFTKKITLL